ncbi:MAG: ABC transporter ATP-binding protein [Thermodesulfobacteriota bacterium]
MIIEIDAVEMIFGAGRDLLPVLKIPHWQVEEGARVAIFGPSGSGKSTFLHLLGGLLVPSKGMVQVCGERLADFSEVQRDRFRARYIGYIFQNFNLLPGFNILENVLVGMTFSRRKANPEEAAQLLDEVGLSHRLKHHPSQLSSGEQQRVAVARALANRPRILLADEPTASLHPVNKEDVLRLLLDMCDRYGCTLVLVTHEGGVLSLFDAKVEFAEINKAW